MDEEDLSPAPVTTPYLCNITRYCNDTFSFRNDTATESGRATDYGSAARIAIIGALTIFGNVLVILSVLLNRDLRETRYAFITSMATVDKLTGFFIVSGAVYNSSPGLLNEHPMHCFTIYCFLFGFWAISIFHMVLIAIDRYLVITKPFTYETIMTRFRCACLIAGAWLGGIFVGLLPLMGWRPPLPAVINCDGPSFVMTGEYLMFVCFGVFFLPLFVMCVLYGRLAHVAVQQRRKIQALHVNLNAPAAVEVPMAVSGNAQPIHTPASGNQSSESGVALSSQSQQSRLKIFKREMRTTKTLLMILGAFTLSWIPFAFMLIVEYMLPGFYDSTLNDVAFSFSMLNSTINPILYALRDVPLRKTLKKIIKCQRV
ncbi:adenosine receptor A1-like [Ptychodera flava]|uniref:adenosine receptor A1-like n=1 Tax=Ptychodera flava TaxID=63121 RepID=UPI00396A075D